MGGVEIVIRLWRVVVRLCLGLMFLIISAFVIFGFAAVKNWYEELQINQQLLGNPTTYIPAVFIAMGLGYFGTMLLDSLGTLIDLGMRYSLKIVVMLPIKLIHPEQIYVGTSVGEAASKYFIYYKDFLVADISMMSYSRLDLSLESDRLDQYVQKIQDHFASTSFAETVAYTGYQGSLSREQSTIDRLRAEASEPLSTIVIVFLISIAFVRQGNIIVPIIIMICVAVSCFVLMQTRRKSLAAFLVHSSAVRYIAGPADLVDGKLDE